MVKMTSAYANKLLRQLEDDKNFYVDKESTSCTYVSALGEEAVIPEYDYAEVDKEISTINKKIQKIKHAINLANVNSNIDVGGEALSADVILIRMAQLNRRKDTLDYMRKMQVQQRQESRSYVSRTSSVPEYRYINFDLELVKKDFEKVSHEIMQLQIALDKHNQTFEFEVDI